MSPHCCTSSLPGALKKTDLWTQSRQNLEEAIEEEKENTEHKWDSDLMSHEQRLDQRLDKLKLDMFIMGSDGACQVRAFRHNLASNTILHIRCFLQRVSAVSMPHTPARPSAPLTEAVRRYLPLQHDSERTGMGACVYMYVRACAHSVHTARCCHRSNPWHSICSHDGLQH